MGPMADGRITVFLADDNVIVREGVRALLGLEEDLEVVGTAEDYDGLLSGAESAASGLRTGACSVSRSTSARRLWLRSKTPRSL